MITRTRGDGQWVNYNIGAEQIQFLETNIVAALEGADKYSIANSDK